jgi:biopolymer transport protein ExbD
LTSPSASKLLPFLSTASSLFAVPLFTPRRRRKPEINIVPLVDVLVVLIFFFLMSTQFKEQKALDITPPKMETASNQPTIPHRVLVAVDKEGKYFVGSKEVTEAQLDEALKTAKEKDGPNTVVLLLADQDTVLKNVTHVMDESRKLSLEIRLQTR